MKETEFRQLFQSALLEMQHDPTSPDTIDCSAQVKPPRAAQMEDITDTW